jgi:hypothetical protein
VLQYDKLAVARPFVKRVERGQDRFVSHPAQPSHRLFFRAPPDVAAPPRAIRWSIARTPPARLATITHSGELQLDEAIERTRLKLEQPDSHSIPYSLHVRLEPLRRTPSGDAQAVLDSLIW